MSLLRYLTPPHLKPNIAAILTLAHSKGWSDALVAHVLFREEEREQGQKPGAARIAVWRWRTGKGMCSEPWRIAEWVGVTEHDLLYRDLEGKVTIPEAPEVAGIKVYAPRVGAAPRVEVPVDVAPAPVRQAQAGSAEWITPARG